MAVVAVNAAILKVRQEVEFKEISNSGGCSIFLIDLVNDDPDKPNELIPICARHDTVVSIINKKKIKLVI